MSHVVSALVVTALILWMFRWVWLRMTAKGRALREWATSLRPKEKAERAAKAEGNAAPVPPPSKMAAAVGTGAGGLAQGAVLAWKAGWPGFLLGWDRGRDKVNDWWLNRGQSKPTDPDSEQKPEATDLTKCPDCGYDLALNSWPVSHKNPKTKKPCDYDWSTDDRWEKCPKCGELYPPGIDKCDCGHRVATGPTRFDPEPEPAATPDEPVISEEPPAPAPTAPKGTPEMAITETGPAEIRTIEDLIQTARANRGQAQADLEDASAAVTRAQVHLRYARAAAEAAPQVLNNDPAAAAAQAAQVEPAAAALKAALAHRAAAEAKFNTASAALRALQPHVRMQQATAETGGKASSQTKVYANN